jgi:hypothetical protein
MTVTDSRAAVVTLPADNQILITREFAAPRHLVFLAWTTPELIRRWWSGGRGEVTGVEVDLRPGGRWRYVLVAEDGTEAAFRGEYREVVPDERTGSGPPASLTEPNPTRGPFRERYDSAWNPIAPRSLAGRHGPRRAAAGGRAAAQCPDMPPSTASVTPAM